MKKFFIVLALFIIPILPLSAAAPSSIQKGYQARACGFDMDDDGRIGEPEDCKVCNGFDTNVDNDATIEDQLYVDAKNGVDAVGRGTPQAPYKTISYAWSKADGATDGAEDIICFKGTAKEEKIKPPVQGVAGVWTKPKSGSQAIDWEYPKNPTMLVGWDADRDGKYPPFDTDDTAILDGSGDRQYRGLSYAFWLSPASDYLELAHFKVKDYGRYYFPEEINPNMDPDLAQESGFIHFYQLSGGDSLHHVSVHDLSIEDVNRDRMAASHRIMFNLFKGVETLNHISFSNLNITNTASFMVRGSADRPAAGFQGRDEGPLRWQNITVTARGAEEDCGENGCVPGAFTAWKVWGYFTGVEILDSVFDSQIREWDKVSTVNGGRQATRVLFTHPSECTTNWTIRNNEIKDFRIGFNVTGANGSYCPDLSNRPARTVDNILFEGNRFINTYDQWFDVEGASLRGGDTAKRTTEDVTIKNNIFSTAGRFRSCIWNRVGNDTGANPGKITILDNICQGVTDSPGQGMIMIGQGFGTEPRFPNQNMEIQRNILTGLNANTANIRFKYKPIQFVEDLNLFDSKGFYTGYDGVTKYNDIESWKTATARPSSSKECDLTVDPTLGIDHYTAHFGTCVASTGPGPVVVSRAQRKAVARWKFEEGSGTTVADSTRSGHTLKLTGTPTFVSGILGGGLAFDDAADQGIAASSSRIDNLSGVTIAGWIKHPRTTRFTAIVDKRDANEDGYNLFIDPSSKLSMRINNQTLVSPGGVADDAWHHIAGTYDGTTMKLYVDGVRVIQKPATGALATHGPLTIGRHFSLDTYGFLGKLDEIVMYNRAISSSEVENLFEEVNISALQRGLGTKETDRKSSGVKNESTSSIRTATSSEEIKRR